MSLAKKTLQLFKQRREDVKLKLSKDAVGILNFMLREPHRLGLARAGMVQSNGMPQEFKSPDIKHAKKIATLRKWLVEVVCEPSKDKKGEILFRDFEGSLQQSYCDVMMDVINFYQPVGMLVDYSELYSELYDAFSGKSHKFDSMDAITMPDDEEEPTGNVSKITEAKQKEA